MEETPHISNILEAKAVVVINIFLKMKVKKMILVDITGERNVPIDMKAKIVIYGRKCQIYACGKCFLFKFKTKQERQNELKTYIQKARS